MGPSAAMGGGGSSPMLTSRLPSMRTRSHCGPSMDVGLRQHLQLQPRRTMRHVAGAQPRVAAEECSVVGGGYRLLLACTRNETLSGYSM